MAISTVAAGAEITATHMNDIATALNALNGRAILTASGLWSWPAGVNRIRVYLCGGGGRQGNSWTGGFGGSTPQPAVRGGNSPLCSKLIDGIDAGTSISVTVGAAGVGNAIGGTTSFGTYFQSTGGTGGNSGTRGTDGTHTGDIQHDNHLFISRNDADFNYIGYGQGYPAGGPNFNSAGGPGICVIEW